MRILKRRPRRLIRKRATVLEDVLCKQRWYHPFAGDVRCQRELNHDGSCRCITGGGWRIPPPKPRQRLRKRV